MTSAMRAVPAGPARERGGPLITAIVALVAALGLAAVIGWLLTRRAGDIRATDSEASGDVDTSDLGLSRTGPTVVHFSASWCGPCTQVRRVVDQVCDDLPDVAHVEIDMDANPSGCGASFGSVAADHVHLRRRRPAAIPRRGCAESR